MADETVFIDGLSFKFVGPYGERPETTPKFVLSRASIKCDKMMEFMKKHHNDGWINFDILLAKDQKKIYAKLDTWKPEKKSEGGGWDNPPAVTGDVDMSHDDENIPF
jgi:hypothetical protein